MHHWDSPNDCAVAPSPIVRTYRPDPPSKRKSPNMPSKTAPPPAPLSPRPRGDSGPRHQARSAGTAERPGRNESLVDLVRFFQTQNMTAQIMAPLPQPETPSKPEPEPQPSSPPDTTTALPVATSPNEPKTDIKPELKPFHRRLLQFAQRPKKEASSKSKKEEQQRQIEALTREGYLIPPPLVKGLKTHKEANQSKESLSLSVSRSLSKSKRDVENIGQPWLQAKADGRKRPTEGGRRLASLDLDDFGSMVDVAVSLTPEFDDSVPPPYQPTDIGPSQSSSSMIPVPSSAGDSSPPTSIRPPSSIASTSRSYRNVSIDENIKWPSAPAASGAPGTSQNANSAPNTDHVSSNVKYSTSTPRTSCDSLRRDLSDQTSVRNVTPSQPTLKLFPDVAPPRKSSMAAWRASVVPRNQIVNNLAASASNVSAPSSQSKPSNNKADLESPRQSSDILTVAPTSASEPQRAGDLEPKADSAAPADSEKMTEESNSPSQVKSRRTSLSMGTLKAFPLPAPTRPLPSLPEVERSPSAPPESGARSIRSTQSGPRRSNLHSSSGPVPDAEETESVIDSPRTLDSRPATALGSIGAGGSLADDEESLFASSISDHSKSGPGLCAPRGRASSVRIPRMQELPETPDQDKGQPLADSPVLGHGTPTKPKGKHAATELRINPKVARENAPFGLPSPPPTGSLPAAPPPQHAPPPPPPGRKIGQRNATAPNPGKLSSMRSRDMPTGPGPYRNSMISRSDSSRSSLRNESFPDSHENHQESRPDSPIASSDDEVTGTKQGKKSSRRDPTKYQRSQTMRREHDAEDTQQASGRSRLRFPQPSRPIPHSRSSHSLDQTPSQPQQSQQTHRERESRGRQRAPQADHYLEDRVANLERQNQMLQAALMAALNASGKNPFEGLNIDPNLTPSFKNNSYVNQYPSHHSRRDSWVSSSRSSEHSGYDANSCQEGRPNVKHFDHMIEDIETGWMSDKSSLNGARIAHRR